MLLTLVLGLMVNFGGTGPYTTRLLMLCLKLLNTQVLTSNGVDTGNLFPMALIFNCRGRVTQMESKIIIGVLFSAVVAVLGWSVKTTQELTLSVQRLEIILLHDAMDN
jgi:hypothetical protein